MNLTPELSAEYTTLFNNCIITPSRKPEVVAIKDKIVAHKDRYQKVEAATKVPWYVVAVIHNMEASLNWNTHLHNGDPLTHKTVHVPAGRPPGPPPYTWEGSAIDALQLDNLAGQDNWDVPHMLWRIERFNGFGYRNHGINSPYLWAASNNYTKGKYVSDGQWDPNAVSQQIGAAVILHLLDYLKLL